MVKKAWRFTTILKRVLKYFGIAIAIIFLLISVISWVVVEKKNDWLLSQIQSYMHESQSGHLEIASINFKIFKNFPDVTVELDSVLYYEHHDTLRTSGEKPILNAAKLFVAIELLPLINDELKISEISLSNAHLNLVKYKDGKFNIDLAMTKPTEPVVVLKKVTPKPSTPAKGTKPKAEKARPSGTGVQIDLKSISFNEVRMTLTSYKNRKPSVIFLDELEVELSKNNNFVYVEFFTSCEVQQLTINRTTIPPGELTADLELKFDHQTRQLTIQQSEINYNDLDVMLQGTYAPEKKLLDLEVDASSNDLELLSMFIKREVLERNPDLLKQVDVYAKGKIKGELTAPQVDISFGLRDLDLTLPRNLGTFKNIGFDGSFTSGSPPAYSQAKLEIKNLRGQVPGGFVKGAFSLKNFSDPYLKYNLDAELKLDGYDEIFNLNSIKALTGSISLHANFDGPLKYFKQHSMDSSRSSSITLNDLSFIVSKTNQKVSDLSGKIENKNNLATIQHLTFTYGKNDLLLDGAAENLMHYILLRDTALTAYGKLQSKQLYTNDFIFDTLSSAEVQDRISNLSFDFQTTITNYDTLAMPDIAFAIQNLSASFDELPDLKQVSGRGRFSKPDSVFRFDLYEFHATLPQGKVDIIGDLIIPEKRLWEFNARLSMNKFPWTYVKELAAEIRTDQEPVAKNLPVKEMTLVTGELDISAAIITYPFDFNKLDIRNSSLTLQTADSKTLSVDKFDIVLGGLRFKHPENSGSLTGLEYTQGTMSVTQLKLPGLNALDVNLNVLGKNDSLDISFSSATQVAESEKGRLRMDISKNERAYHLQYTVTGANLEYFVEKFYKKDFMKGEIDYALDIQSSGPTWEALKQKMAGEITITGDSLHLSGVDIDKLLRRFERSQNFNLTDVGAILIAGPVGLAVTKGTDFVSLATINLNPKHRTFIKELNTTWRLEDRQLITKDVAFATLQNRVAFDGRIDFAHDSIPGLTIAVVDKNGCSLMDQKLYGKTSALKTGKLNIAKTLFGSVINFVNVIVGKDCKPVYTGKVNPPQ
jgi:hypothetical protein